MPSGRLQSMRVRPRPEQSRHRSPHVRHARPLHDHVLGRFTDEEQEAVAEAVSRAADAFEFANAHGLEAAMNQFNQKNQDP